MKVKLSHIVLLLVVSFILSCSDSQENNSIITSEGSYNEQTLNSTGKLIETELSPSSYIEYWSNDANNFYVKTKQIAEFNYSLKYLPVEYMVCNELKNKKATQQEIDSLMPEYDGMEYYELKISVDDFVEETIKYQLSDMNEYQNRVKYLSFAMQSDLKAVLEKNKVIDCKLFHYERTFGLAPYTKVLFAFSKEDIGDAQERTIVFEDNLFNKGLIKFNWLTNDLISVPKISVL